MRYCTGKKKMLSRKVILRLRWNRNKRTTTTTTTTTTTVDGNAKRVRKWLDLRAGGPRGVDKMLRLNLFWNYGNTAHKYGKYGTQNTAAHVFRLDLKDCCTCVPPRSEILLLHFRLTVVKLKNECAWKFPVQWSTQNLKFRSGSKVMLLLLLGLFWMTERIISYGT